MKHVLQNIEVNELSRTHRILRRMIHELSAMAQNARLAMFHHNQRS